VTDGLLLALALVPLLIGAAAAALARWAARRLEPAAATVLLTALALSVALVTGMLLCLLGIVGLAQVPWLSGLGHWHPAALRMRTEIHPLPALAAGAVAAVLLMLTARYAVRVWRSARALAKVTRSAPAAGDLVIVDDDAAFAFAVPGREGRIVVSTTLLRDLDAPQRRVLLAHEAAHLQLRHDRYVQLGRLAAAANPLMRPVSRAIDLAVERWADEVAAREVGDRRTAARALAAAGLARPMRRAPHGALAGAQADVRDRVTSLLAPPTKHRALGVAALGLVLACWIAGGLVIQHLHALMELAEKL
jgi:hypothetical protein